MNGSSTCKYKPITTVLDLANNFIDIYLLYKIYTVKNKHFTYH